MKQAIGFLGFGEAASHIARGFSSQDTVECYAYDVMLKSDGEHRRILDQRLQETHVIPVHSEEELLQKAKVIFLIIPAKFARDAAMAALPYMTKEHLFCDLTTNKPDVKNEIGRTFEKKKVLYVDASVMGAVPLYQHKTPTIVSGNGAQRMIELLGPMGMNLTNAGSEPGRAVKMKLTRSIFVKGVEALTMEMLMTARALGIETEIVQGIEESFHNLGFKKFCGQLVTSGVQHDERRALEAKECAELEKDLNINSTMMEAAFQKLQWYADLGYQKMEPLPVCENLNDIYDLWERTGILPK